MSNATMSRRPAGPVRQHSLQQPPRRQQQIRRQRSTEDERNLQIYSSSNSLVSSRNNRFSTTNPSKYDSHQHHHHHLNHNHVSVLERPKVRVAWSEHQSQKSKNDGGVEIVARQIPTAKSSSRPTTGRANQRRYPLAEKATILYSRQELAERLRLAWKQREENKSNIDIFLAHNTVEERSESRMSSATNRTALSTPKISVNDDDLKLVKECADETKTDEANKQLVECAEARKVDERKFQTWFTSFESTGNTPLSEDRIEHHDEPVRPEDDKKNQEIPPENENNVEEEVEKEEQPVIEKKSSISIDCNNWNTSISTNIKSDAPIVEIISKAPIPIKEISPDYSQAKLKRASYQSGTNKAFLGPIIPDKPSTPRSRVNSFHQQDSSSRFRRTSSAPPQRRTQVNIIIDTPTMLGEPTRAMSANGETKNLNRPIKSAPPVKRRSKGGKRRGLSKDEDNGEEGRTKSRGSKGKSVGTLETKGAADVVTMVSLVSSADSESEMDENSPRDDKLICELRNKLPTTPIIKSSNGLSGGIRKPFKSVSFQQDSFDYDSPPRLEHETATTTMTTTTTTTTPTTTATISSRTTSLQARFVALSRAANAASSDDTPLLTAATMTMSAWAKADVCPSPSAALLQLQQQKSLLLEPAVAQIEAPLTDREKRCLAVPIGDIHDKKRKLVRCRSAAAAPRLGESEKQQLTVTSRTCLQPEMRMSQPTSGPQENQQSKVITIPMMPTAEPSEEKDKNAPTEPYCQTPKEKECWHLYRRMCDKGVFVSFDTVLRGMLTPTEYRLRQKEMSQNC